MDRRSFLATGLSLPFATAARSQTAAPFYLADMHFHSFFGQSTYHSRPVGKTFSDGGATLVAWKIVGDIRWIQSTDRGYKQKGEPVPGEAMASFKVVAGLVKAHAAEQKLKFALTPGDVDLALKGDPHIVLAVEGATFVENVAHVQVAYDLGLRHLQLVHYIRNPLGDFQTEKPEHNGLTELGRQVILECNRLGILVDLAHCTPEAIKAALAISKAPMVWSHSSIASPGTKPNFSMLGWRARQLTVEDAKAIAAKGGVIGLWAIKQDVGETVDAYGKRLLEMAAIVGDNHVGFGTDINGLGPFAMIFNYVDVRKVVEGWQKQNVSEARIRKMAIENYARVLKAALVPVKA